MNESSGLAKFSCTLAQYTGMLDRVQFRGRSRDVGRGWWVVRKEREACENVIEWEHYIALYTLELATHKWLHTYVHTYRGLSCHPTMQVI